MNQPRVCIDIMGGDHAPGKPVAAALSAVIDHGIPVTMVGSEQAIQREIGSRNYPMHLVDVVDAPEHVSMEDEAVSAVRRKRRASIPVGLELLKSGDVDAFVSAGNTGAVVASATVSLGRLAGVSRPGIAIQIPTLGARPVVLIDAGALIDPKPEHLWQHARLASAYAAANHGLEAPRIGLISNGEESSKGNALTRTAFQLLSGDPDLNFVGNVESRAIPQGVCEVAVTDGFTGNIILKTSEGIVSLIQENLRNEFRSRWHTMILAALLRPAFRRAGRALDYREYGGAPLLGVDGLVMIAHGSSDELALVNAIRAASDSARLGTMQGLRSAMGTSSSSRSSSEM